MRPPGFWSHPPDRPGLRAHMLAPFAAIWLWESRRRRAQARPFHARVPVICAGNLGAGGAGKTPMVMAIIERLTARGKGVHVLSRGHGGTLRGPLRVDPRAHEASAVGDEPLLLAAIAPVWIGRDRAASARAAVADGAEVLVMDDGFQNPRLHQDLSVVVVDAGAGFGNGRVIPAGPLREPVAAGIARADFVCAIGSSEERGELVRVWPQLETVAMLDGTLAPLETGMDWRGMRALAFAGIGRPGKFFASLSALGVEIVAAREFSDHAPYHPRILDRLARDARAAAAQLVTTEKDAARLPRDFLAQVLVLPVRLALEDWTPFDAQLDRLGI